MLDLVLSTNELHFETFRSVKLGGDEQENGEENGTEELTNEKVKLRNHQVQRNQEDYTIRNSRRKRMR